jgi:RNA polymerase sigma-70 factor, ECF subfamily
LASRPSALEQATAWHEAGLEAWPVARETIESIVRATSPALIRTLTLIVLDRESAADIAQDTFVQLHRHWEQVARHPNPRAWIYRVALNRAADHRRVLARGARLVERLGHHLPEHPTVGQWEPDLEFVSVLRALPMGQRKAAALRYLGDLSVPQIALAMGISEGAVNSHLHRARLALKEVLER